MKFFVSCDLNEIESTDLTVEAPTAQIAEAKVRSCFPSCVVHSAEPIEKDDVKIYDSLRLCFRPLFYTSAGIFLLLFFGWNFFWYQALICAPIAAFIIFWLVPVCYFFIATATGDIARREEIMELEREYARRKGYQEGWQDCERKAEPKFTDWAKSDRQDIKPNRGDALKNKSVI